MVVGGGGPVVQKVMVVGWGVAVVQWYSGWLWPVVVVIGGW